MLTEDYISFETAKLLKEKGFDGECHSHYYPCHYPDGSIQYHKYERTESTKNKSWYDIYSLKNLPADHYLAPTLQMAMKWLREIYNLEVIIKYDFDKGSWWGSIFPMYEETDENSDMYQKALGLDHKGNYYEEACEATIKYCLENLI